MRTKVFNLESPRTGHPVANQFIIQEFDENERLVRETFQSYESIIARWNVNEPYTLDPDYWDYSVTTLKYLKQFLGISASKADIAERIKNGTYKTVKLN